MKRAIYFAFLFLVSSSLLLPGQTAPPKANAPTAQPQASAGPASTVPDEFVIGPEDVLSVNVWKEPDLSIREIVVRPDGRISLPLIEEIQATGLTARQLQDRIAEKLKEFVASPSVTVTITKISSQAVSIVGEVRNPGVYPLGAPMSVLELLARAGGFTELAKTKKIRIIRKEGGQIRQFDFNYKNIVNGKDIQQNILLRNGDSVIVP